MESAQYIAYLLSEPRKVSCIKASEVLEVSHDEINRFLLSNNFTGKDLFEAVRQGLKWEGGVLSADDSVLDKPFTDPDTTELVGFFYSGRHHRTVKGINLITLFYTDASGVGFPVNFRVYRHREGKTKHEYFREMVKECWQWGLRPASSERRQLVCLHREPEVPEKPARWVFWWVWRPTASSPPPPAAMSRWGK
jgi:hypothetical protein